MKQQVGEDDWAGMRTGAVIGRQAGDLAKAGYWLGHRPGGNSAICPPSVLRSLSSGGTGNTAQRNLQFQQG